MREAYQIVQDKSAARKKKDVDRRKLDGKKILGDLIVGDRVLVKNVREKGGPGKIRSHWEQKIYVVSEKKSDVVYSVIGEGEKDKTKTRVLHRNMLLPVSQWFLFEKPKKVNKIPKKPRKTSKLAVDEQSEAGTVSNDSEDDDSGEWFAIYPDIQHQVQFPGTVLNQEGREVEDNVQSFENIPEVEELEDNNIEGEEQDEDDDQDVTVEYDEEEARHLLDELPQEGIELEEAEEIREDEIVEVERHREVEVDVEQQEETEERVSVENEEVERGVQGETGENLLVNNDREVRRRGPPKKFTYDELGVPSMVDVGYSNLVGEVEAMKDPPFHNNMPTVMLSTSHVPVRSNNYVPAVAGGNNPHCTPVNSVMSNVSVLCNVSTPSQFSVRLTDVPGQTMANSNWHMADRHLTRPPHAPVPVEQRSHVPLNYQSVPVQYLYPVNYVGGVANQYLASDPVQYQQMRYDVGRQTDNMTDSATDFAFANPLPPSGDPNWYCYGQF